MTLILENVEIFRVATKCIFAIFVLSTIIQMTHGYARKEIRCGKNGIKCIFPEEACDGDSCRNCLPECNKPYQARLYGCEPKCNEYDQAPSHKDSKTKVCSLEYFQNGNIYDGCSGMPGVICGYLCADKYTKNPDVPAVQCLSSGNWSSDLDKLCSPAFQCPIIELSNAEMASSCSRDVGSSCDIKCKYENDETKNRKTVWCLPSGNWTQDNQEINQFCQKESAVNWNIIKLLVEAILLVIGAIGMTLLILMLRHRCHLRKRKGTTGETEEDIALKTDENENGDVTGNEEGEARHQVDQDNRHVAANEQGQIGIQEEDNSESAELERTVHQPNDEDDGEYAGNEEGLYPDSAFNNCKNTC